MRGKLCWAVLAVFLFVVCVPGFAAEKEWTYLVFMNADNNLDPFADEDFQEMMKIGSSDWLNIVTLTDREKGPANLHFIEKGKNVVLKPMGELDMGDYKVMVDFVRDAAKAYPARHYVLSIWNHGSGWNKHKGQITKGISYDDSTGNCITTPQLGVAMKEIQKILGKNLDILSMDACLMQMMEVVYEVNQTCDFVVASEETEPGHGYPYEPLLAELKADTSAEAFCKAWIPIFMKAYMGGVYENEACTLSAIRCAHLPALKEALDGLARILMAGSFAPQMKQALAKVQKFDERTFIDLLHLVRLFKGLIPNPEVQSQLTRLEGIINKAVVANGNTGGSLKNALGLAIYFPATSFQFSSEYAILLFSQEALWDDLLKDFYQKSAAQPIVADVQKQNLDSLRDFVKAASQADQEIRKYVKTQVQFLVLVERMFPPGFQREVTHLLSQL